MNQIDLTVKGMTCTHCTASVKNYLEGIGAQQVNIDLSKELVKFKYGKSHLSQDQIDGIEKMGYKVISEYDEQSLLAKFLNVESFLIISSIFTLFLVLDHITYVIGNGHLMSPMTQFFLTLPVYIIGLYHFGRSAFFAIKNGSANMDVLIILGASAAFIYSCYGLSIGDTNMLFFETCASIITLVLLGNWIERRALKTTKKDINLLSGLLPEKTQRILANGSIQMVKLDDLNVGDLILIREGDNCPVDGKIIKGTASVDESLITGESEAITKMPGSEIFSGTLISRGHVEVLMTKSTDNSYVNRIVELMNQAQAEKPDIQRLADRISAWFVPIVLIIALLVFVVEYFVFNFSFSSALLNSIAVLVISCPCAMGLATPTALAVGIGVFAKKGILIKGKNAIQNISEARSVIFDKTGTLTDGRMKVSDWTQLSQTDKDILPIVLKMEQISNHPIAKVLTGFLLERDIQVYKELIHVEEIAGMGIQCNLDGAIVYVGRDRFSNFDVVIEQNHKQIYGLNMSENILEDSKEAISEIRDQGLSVILLSGDREEKVKRVAQELNIDEFYYAVKPKDKFQTIKRINDTSKSMMVGDGINDAPALGISSVGVSFSDATSIAQDQADVILVPHRIRLISYLRKSSIQITKTIRQNLFWAFIYNIIAIPLAAAGYLNPMIAAASMAFSDVVVIGNSLLLRSRMK